ncbi:P-loop containing nucleoside triphosphate hydrolases superfamily protein isoform 2 [Hibiscus syriacus]|uniref:P-loop containing nucleoside triphosphate hydrolases superfamily protein isoform 2 n=1 Tax=Hibiscus syriacus TaxID=106335 RepID=A0A6A3D5H0_HIBSY|nr:DNA-binding protein SMUBP-2-like [Hibiscus syriacus]KAE8734601.1 P-loop containing nucleoside triphosphate hydrolases superfamily protein isoform 2 [Hibiscus syriacus]
MEKASCSFCGRIPSTTTTKAFALSVQKSSCLSSLPFSFSPPLKSICLFVGHKYNLPSTKFHPKQFVSNGSGESSGSQSSSKFITTTKKKPRSNPKFSKSEIKSTPKPSDNLSRTKILVEELGLLKKQKEQKVQKTKSLNVRTLYQNGDPLGRRDLGKKVVRWISEGMKAMALDFVSAELQGEFLELRQRMGPGLTFVIQAQPYLSAIPIPLGLEAISLKTCAHYPTLFDHFQRELRNLLQDLQQKSVVDDWKETQSWKLLKELANSSQHRAIARKNTLPKTVQGVLGMDLEKAKVMQGRIDEFTIRMSELLQIERDAELEFTQEELDAVPTPDEGSDSSKPIEFLVRHGQAQQELCDTICSLNAVSTSTGLGGMHLVLFRVEGNHRLPPTTLSPGDMVCVRISDSRGAGATSCIQGFVDNLGDDGCSISVAMDSRHGDPTFSKLFGKSVRIDRIHGLADTLTYERNCEALMLLQKNGLQKKNPSIAVVATLFGDKEDVEWLEENGLVEWNQAELDGLQHGTFDNSQRKAIALGLNKKRPLMVVQGPPGTGKTGMLNEIIALAAQQGERVLVTAPTNAAVDNMVEKLSDTGLNIVRVGNPARISSAVASKSLVEIVNSKLADYQAEFERKKSDLRKDLRLCLKDDSLAAGIRQLLKQLGKALKKKEKETVKEVLSSAQVVLSTNTGAADPLIRKLDTFDMVVIDEAGQAIEPSCWIPILQGKRCILAGDQCQLAPVILSRKALEGGLGVSLLERAATLHEGVLATMLRTQYRMNDAIASWASKEMYDGELKSSPSVASHLLVDSPFVKPTWITQCPLLLLDTRMPYGSLSVGCEEHLDLAGTGSFFNEGEADIVVQHVFYLIFAGVSPTAIAVQSPYVAQVQLLRDRLDELPEAAGVEVATIDSFQGREADAVIISMVRSNTLGAVGFLGDSRRMNVAITRARKHVTVVCDSSTICHNTFLARLLRHIRYVGRVKHAEPGASGGSGLGMNPMLPSIS